MPNLTGCCLVIVTMGNFADPKWGGPPGSLTIEIQQAGAQPSEGGTPFAVGVQHLPARQFIIDQTTSHNLLPNIERIISIYFQGGKQLWVIFASFIRPKESADKNTEIFYQLVSTVRYDP